MRQKGLVDWDNTLRRGFTVFDWTRHLRELGLVAPGVHNTMSELFAEYSNRRISYEYLASQSAGIYARGLAGISARSVRESARTFVAHDDMLFPFAVPLVKRLQTSLDVAVISGCPQEVLDAYSPTMAVQSWFGLRLKQVEGRFTGEIITNPALVSGKRQAARGYLAGTRAIVALGDSASDVPLFEMADVGFAMGNPTLVEECPRLHLVNPWQNPDSLVDEIMLRISSALDRQ